MLSSAPPQRPRITWNASQYPLLGYSYRWIAIVGRARSRSSLAVRSCAQKRPIREIDRSKSG